MSNDATINNSEIFKLDSYGGLKVTGSDKELGEIIKKFIENFLGYKKDVTFILGVNPDICPLLNIFKSMLFLKAHSFALHEKVLHYYSLACEQKQKLESEYNIKLEEWEQGWLNLFCGITNGADYSAIRKTVIDNGKNTNMDLLNLRVGMVFCIYRGDKELMKELIDLYSQNEEHFNNPHFLGIAGFIYEELGELDKSETYVKKGLDIDPSNIWLQHVYVHILYDKTQLKESIKFLEERRHLWNSEFNTFVSKHIKWHLAIAYLYNEQVDKGNEIINELAKMNIDDEAESGLALLGYIVRLYLQNNDFINTEEVNEWVAKLLAYFEKTEVYTVHLLFDCLAVWLMSTKGEKEILGKCFNVMNSNIEIIKDAERQAYLKEHYVSILKAIVKFSELDYESTYEILTSHKEAVNKLGGSDEQVEVIYEIERYCKNKLNK
jgi:tetratricopeptide (TPR) repeat protein